MKISLKLLVLFCTLLAGQAMAATCTAKTGSQDWDDKGSWTGCGNNPPQKDDIVIIPSGSTVTLDKDTKDIASLTVASGGVLLGDANNNKLKLKAPGDLTNNGTITLNTAEIDMKGNLANNGTFNAGSDKIKIEGNLSNSGTFNAQTSEVEFSGNGVQTVSGNVTFYDLKVDNGSSNGLLLNGNVVVTGSVSGDAVSGGLVKLSDTCPVDYTLTSNNGNTVQHSCPPPPGPIAEYRFDEISPGTVSDSSGNSLNGTVHGGITVGGAGKVCGSYKFNGTNAYVSVPNNALLNQSKVTVMSWVRHSTANRKTWESIVAKGDSAYRLHLNGGCSINGVNTLGGLSFGINSGCATADINSGSVPAANTWYHVSGTYDGSTIKIYVNGALSASRAYSGSINSNTFPLYIGDNSQNTGRFWSGDIDEVKIFDSALTAAQISSGYANENAGKNWDGSARACSVTAPHHLEIESASTGLTCAASTLTVRACADAACTTPYTGGVTGTLTANGTPTVNWDGTTGGASGAGFEIPAGSSFVTKNFQVASAGSVQLGVTSPSPLPTNATTCNFGSPFCTFTASTAGFIFSNTATGNAYTIPPQVSGVSTATNALYLRAVQAASTNAAICTPAIIGQTVNVNMGYTCNNPATCQPGSLATINTTAIASGTPVSTPVSLTFDANGSAPITVRSDDVGQITLNASKVVTPPGGTAVTLNGASNAFVVAPHHFGFSNVTAGPIKAGNNFAATLTAYNGLATPTVTRNFGKETAAEGITLTSTLVTPNPVTYPAAANPAIANNAIAGSEFGASGMVNDANGAATVNNLAWGEVGSMTLTATLTSGSYLGSGLVPNVSTSATVGEFIPDHLDTAVIPAPDVPMPCPGGLTCPALYNGFVYSGQPFSVQVTARNLANGPTTNYHGTYGLSHDVTLSAWDALGSVVIQNPPGGGAAGVLGNPTVPASAFTSGVATTTTPTYTLPSATTPPADIYLRAVDSVNPSVSSLRAAAASSVEGGVKVASGRIRIPNAYGSERLALPLTVTVQYYNGSNWLTSLTDSVTSFDSHLSTATPTPGNLVASVVTGLSSGLTVSSPATAAVAAGVRAITLAAPDVSGSATISLNAPAYLPSSTARATFGIYRSPLIYRRENY